MSADRVKSIDVMGRWACRRMASYAFNPCPMPPVCEFGEYGCEAMYSYPTHVWGYRGCIRCGVSRGVKMKCRDHLMGNRPELDMVNVRPCYGGPPAHQFGEECAAMIPFVQCHGRDDWAGNRPEVDRVNVVPCDGTLTADAILFGPVWIADSEIRKAGGDPDKIGREGAEFVRELQRRHRCE